ncbi:MAG: DUF996 domain-containing protein [Candidatus Bathyarchaeia archaeon]|jgi:uncharacterized membrane protein
MTLESSKTLGGIGAILLFIGIFPVINYFGIIDLVGAILVLVGLYGLSGYFRERGIFNNALIAVVVLIIGSIIVAVLAFTVLFANASAILYQIYPGWDGNWASLQGMTPDPNAFNNANFADWIPIFGALAAVWIGAWIIAIISTFFIRRSLVTVANRSNTGLFGTAGLLMLIGGFLAIVLIGYLLIWIGFLLMAIAFFQLKHTETTETPPATAYSPPPPTTV